MRFIGVVQSPKAMMRKAARFSLPPMVFPSGNSRSLMAAVISLALATAGQSQEPPVAIAADVPAGLLETATKLRPALFFSRLPLGDKVVPQVGFFIDDTGLALCPLGPLHAKPVPDFRTGEGKSDVLKSPVVLGVFPDQALALVKFDHKPAASLTIAKEAATVGTWVAVVPSGFTGGGMMSESAAGPIMAHRITHNVSTTHPPRPPQKQFSIATGNGPTYQRLLRPGSPLVNGRGEVVAAFAGSQAMPGQTLQLAFPLDGFQGRIEQAVAKGKRLKIPLAAEDLALDPAILSDEFRLMGASAVAGDTAKARQLARALVGKFPGSMTARSHEFGFASQEVAAGRARADELVDLAKRSQPQESATALDQASYHEQMGQALMRAGRLDEAMASLRKSRELDSRAMACISLAPLHEKSGDLEKAEDCWREATTLDAERIEFWDRFQRILTARGKWKEAAAAQERVFLLEDLYRSR
jgi:hypothetical protein